MVRPITAIIFRFVLDIVVKLAFLENIGVFVKHPTKFLSPNCHLNAIWLSHSLPIILQVIYQTLWSSPE